MPTPVGRTAVLLDPNTLWLDGVERVLHAADVEVVGKASRPDRALELIAAHRPDLVVAEIRLDEGSSTHDGIAWIRAARRTRHGLRVVVLSTSNGADDIELALAAGAAAYVIKTAHPDDLAAAVRQVFDHSMFLGRTRPPHMALNEDGVVLTRREREILQLVAEGHSNAELAGMLWVTEQTVKFHLSNIYKKIGVSNRTEASRWAQRRGLLTPVEPEAKEGGSPAVGTSAP